MSLKAKLEAVIYAADEPVTLAQLAVLFTDEALEWKAEQQAAQGGQAEEPTDSTETVAEALPQLSEAFPHLELEPVDSSRTGADTNGAEPATEGNSNIEANAEPEREASPEETAAAEAEAKQQAKLRDREVRVVIGQLLTELIAEYAADERGIEIREIAGGYRMATKPQCHDAVRLFVKSLKPPMKLSLPALETLAVIAYKQPVTAPEVNEIRGVDSSGVFGSLLARKLIVTAGRKPVVGRPILYKTTREFLLRFGLKDVSELPSMEEFEKMAASELEEPEMEQEETPGGTAEPDTEQSVEQDEEASAGQSEPELHPHENAPDGAE
jgi:segregation and condensation protein B